MAQNIVCLVAITLALGKSKYSAVCLVWYFLSVLVRSNNIVQVFGICTDLCPVTLSVIERGDVLSDYDCGFGFFKQA